MKYAYYPGCTLHCTAREYDESTRAVFAALGVELEEIRDWNCCGTSALPSTGYLFSLVVPARNLALAEEAKLDVAVACNACFVALRRAKKVYSAQPEWRAKMAAALRSIGKELKGEVQIRHILDLVVNEVGLARVKEKIVRKLTGLKVVPYYGCQLSRPRNEFANPEVPEELDRLLRVVGADVLRYDHKTKCCGNALMTTKEEVALELNHELLHEAQTRGADMIVVSCPLCQFNLDAFQDKINARFGTRYHMPVLYFTQVLGLALGIPASRLGIRREVVSAERILRKYMGEVG